MKSSLKKNSFKADPCLCSKEQGIILFYVNNIIISSKQKDSEKTTLNLNQHSYTYFGIQVETKGDGDLPP